MLLALLIAICLASAVLAGVVAARRRPLARIALAAAVVVPLGAFLALQTLARPGRSTLSFEVLGQY
ncbi:MAG TPA: hypothetical protein VK864_01615, partial [Longimicrobiales bacterium]|nr:hypothetical protein [Longimicrobiales bacterium]